MIDCLWLRVCGYSCGIAVCVYDCMIDCLWLRVCVHVMCRAGEGMGDAWVWMCARFCLSVLRIITGVRSHCLVLTSEKG
jgi:hypothetical protein